MGGGAPRHRDPHRGGSLQARPRSLGRSSEARPERHLASSLPLGAIPRRTSERHAEGGELVAECVEVDVGEAHAVLAGETRATTAAPPIFFQATGSAVGPEGGSR